MNAPIRRHHRRVARSRRDERGLTLVETLVAIAVLSITMIGIFTATMTATRTSSLARVTAQMNTLATGFSEVIKSLPYEVCATPDHYDTEFTNVDLLSPEEQRLRESLGAHLEVVSVTDYGQDTTQCPSLDSGTQLITVRVTVGERSLDAQVVKRNPDPLPRNESVVINTPTWRSNLNDPQNIVALSATAKLESGVYLVEWWCDADWALDGSYDDAPLADIVKESVDDPTTECVYLSPIAGSGEDLIRQVLVRVTDTDGRVHYSPVFPIELRTTTSGANPPAASIYQITEPPCSEQLLCTADIPVTFDGRASVPGDGFRFEKCTWNFGDGAPEEVKLGTNCHNQAVNHAYVGQGTYIVRLTVTNNLGVSDTAEREVWVDGPPRVRPHVEIKGWALDQVAGWTNAANPTTHVTGVAPQRVQFSPEGSYAHGDAEIASYEWFFGDAPDGHFSGPTGINHRYESWSQGFQCDGVRGYKVTLRVVDTYNVSNEASMCVTLDPLSPPPDFQYSRWRGPHLEWNGILPTIYLNIEFLWRTIAMTPGTPNNLWRMEVRVGSVNQTSCWLGTLTKNFDGQQAQVTPPALTNLGAVRASGLDNVFATVVADLFNSTSCNGQARIVRTYEGQQYVSDWSPAVRIR